ncbi:bifunctional pyr operon transcriptional regulator/uracil phosphoribosyltransferase PyrR [Roseateles asaccharophilus]|uniref:Pyrimidine operon attenuation protein/uracil phosphoribosyltransferase n=1 Tax=Roseateles asaccharophilus TaxID=582607 RepID=A0ABU2ACF2_9BURK|nr:bifunctional pyr operon transcriptional regulator/uracil phosphoribosyltransferase PyrR [Roseateles asaccharophilus]MDR7334882.1 pyrimidine operon attenuation protein/uracil phosphoribosyltransferase [Roseateles asaccharophilus]
MSDLKLDAEGLYLELKKGVQRLLTADTALVGIWSGGAWLGERLAADLGVVAGTISSAMHRDDFGERGMVSGKGGADHTKLPFDVNGRDILLIDDVLYTGRTTRAVINELFDFGRPASVQLAVLVDRGGRQLPIEPAFSAARVTLNADQSLRLAQGEDRRFKFEVK